jgi:integrase
VKWKDAAGRWRKQRTECATKAEAKAFARQLEHRADLQRNHLTPMDGPSTWTFGDLLEWYDEAHAHRVKSQHVRSSVGKHLAPALRLLPLVEVTSACLDELLGGLTRPLSEENEQKPLSPETINHLRSFLHKLFELGIRGGKWSMANPVAGVKRRKVPKRPPAWLRPHEVTAVLPHVAAAWRNLFATAVFTGARRGELTGALKTAVDLDSPRPTITFARSWDSDTTKGGEVRVVPVHPELVPFLRDAIEKSPSELLFPRPDGSMHNMNIDLPSILRSAMARAGLVRGWVHKCRWCEYRTEMVKDAELRRCPTCTKKSEEGSPVEHRKLWPSAIKRTERFHDLRHTTAALLLKIGTPLGIVQKLVGHSDPKITAEIYGHLEAEDSRQYLERLSFSPLPSEPTTPIAQAAGAPSSILSIQTNGLGPPVVRAGDDQKDEAPDPLGFPLGDQALQMVGATGFEPATTCTPKAPTDFPQIPSALFGAHGSTVRAVAHEVRAGVRPAPSTNSIPSNAHGPPVVRFRLVEDVLTVPEVAAVLKVVPATVYALISKGQLAHFRVNNAIRVRRAELERFMAGDQ